MKLKTKVKMLLVLTLPALMSQLFAADATYYIGINDGSQNASGNFLTFESFLQLDKGTFGDGSTTPQSVGNVTIENRTTGEYLISNTDTSPYVGKVSGSVDSKSFTALFTVSCATGGDLGLDQTSSIGDSFNNGLSSKGAGPLTITFTGFEADSDPAVSFGGFTSIDMLQTNNKGAIDFSVNGVDYNHPTTSTVNTFAIDPVVKPAVIIKRKAGSQRVKQLGLQFSVDVSTPALGVTVEQTGALVEWTIGEEISVDYYVLVKKGTTEEVARVYQSDAASREYTVNLAEYGCNDLVDLIVVDKSGKKSNPYSPVNGNEVTGNYSLVKGWNLISVPGDHADLAALKAATIGTFWGWDGFRYVETDTQTAYAGVWVYSDKSQVVAVSAVKADAQFTLQPGWTLAGPANTVEVPEGVSVFEWNGSYKPTVSLDNGKGYWFFTPIKIDVTLDTE